MTVLEWLERDLRTYEPDLIFLLASLGHPLSRLRRADRYLRQGRRRRYQLGSGDPDPHRHRTDQPVADLVRDRAIQPPRTDPGQELAVPAALGTGHWCFVAMLFSRAEAGSRDVGGADRQIERRAGGAVRRGVPRRTAIAERLDRDRLDLGRRGADCDQGLIMRSPIGPRRPRSGRCRTVLVPRPAA